MYSLETVQRQYILCYYLINIIDFCNYPMNLMSATHFKQVGTGVTKHIMDITTWGQEHFVKIVLVQIIAFRFILNSFTAISFSWNQH